MPTIGAVMVVGCIVPQGILYTGAVLVCSPAAVWSFIALYDRNRWRGTKTFLTCSVLLPVPRSPTTCQTSSISYSPRGIKKLPKSTGRPSLITGPPTNVQVAWSHPDDQFHEPLTRYPPSTTVPAPIGAYDDEIRTLVSSPHTSSWAFWSKSARCQLCTPTIEPTQPVDPQALASRRAAS